MHLNYLTHFEHGYTPWLAPHPTGNEKSDHCKNYLIPVWRSKNRCEIKVRS